VAQSQTIFGKYFGSGQYKKCDLPLVKAVLHYGMRSKAMKRRFYPALRVGALERSIAFYGKLGMKEQRRLDVPEGRFTMVWLGWDGDDESPVIGLTYNYGVSTYEHGTAFGQLVIGVPDVIGLCSTLREAGVKITREPGPVKFGTAIIAFIQDPDGYRVELVQCL
jgi:lactoylglutathione lyase